MYPRMATALLIVFALFSFSCGGGSSGGSTSTTTTTASQQCANPVATRAYLMAFHVCQTGAANCSNPVNHTIYIAGSDDGVSWSLIEQWTPKSGSVPDIESFNGYLYLFHTGASEKWAKLNACMEVVDSGDTSVVSPTDSGGFVDPSLIADNGTLKMFYLPGIIGSDPAGCSSYPCVKEIHSGSFSGSDMTTLTQISGARASATLSNGALSDPDIIRHSNGTYYLYVSNGQNVAVFTSATLDGTFASPDGGSLRLVSFQSGGVPSAVEGGDGRMWLYVSASNGGVETIRRAISDDGVTRIADSNFTTVVNSSISPQFTSATSFSSPSAMAWPDSWNR